MTELHPIPAPDPGANDGRTPDGYTAAIATYQRARRELRALLGHGLPLGVETTRFKRVLQPVVDAACAGAMLSAGLDDLDRGEVEPSVHGLRVSLLVVDIARRLGVDRATVVELATAGLLHAVNTAGETAAGGDASRSRARRAAISRLSEGMPLSPSTLLAMRVPLDETSHAESRPLASQLVGIADLYVTLASSRAGDGPRWTASEALGLVLGPPTERFHPALRAALVGALGVHPPGQAVELDDGAVVRVCAANPDDPERPIVERLPDPASPRMTGLDDNPAVVLPAARSVVRAVPSARGGAAAA
jgi:hypothetical protein